MHNSIKDKILDLTDIAEVVGERVPLTRKGRELVGLCPFHDDHKPSMNVSPTKQIFKCWSCGAGGDVIKFVQLYERINFREALERLAERAGIDLRESPAERERYQTRDQLRRVMEWARTHFQRNLQGSAGEAARAYVERRGLSTETIATLGIGLALNSYDDVMSAARRAKIEPDLLHQTGLITTNDAGRVYDRFRNRLIFPICDALGRPVAFGGRTLADDRAKYLNSPETALFQKSRILYNFHNARDAIRERAEVVVVEGYMDAALLTQHGVRNVVATLGTALTDAHVKLLREWAERVVLCFDGDEAGQRAADRGVETAVKHAIRVHVCVLPGGLDPADHIAAHGRAAFEQQLSDATDALEFKWNQVVTTIGRGEQRGTRAAVEAYLAVVAEAGVAGNVHPVEQGLLMQRLAEVVSLPPAKLYEMLKSARGGVRRQSAEAADGGDDTSAAYRVSLEGVPAGLVGAAERVFGLLLRDPASFDLLESTFAESVGYCETWQHLYDVIRELVDDHREYTREEVSDRCDEAAVLELIERALQATSDEMDHRQAYGLASQRLRRELGLITHAELSSRLADTAVGHQVYASLAKKAPRNNGFLPASGAQGV